MSSQGEEKLVIYDRAKYHFKGNFPSNLPIEKAYLHIGMFLGWIIDKKLYSDFFEEECAIQIIRFLRKEIGCTILSEIWDGHLGSDLFTDTGNMFTYYYYGGGLYRKDYEVSLAQGKESIYHVDDTWDNFYLMSEVITKRYEDWKKMIELP